MDKCSTAVKRAKKICPKIALPVNVGFRTIPGMWNSHPAIRG